MRLRDRFVHRLQEVLLLPAARLWALRNKGNRNQFFTVGVYREKCSQHGSGSNTSRFTGCRSAPTACCCALSSCKMSSSQWRILRARRLTDSSAQTAPEKQVPGPPQMPRIPAAHSCAVGRLILTSSDSPVLAAAATTTTAAPRGRIRDAQRLWQHEPGGRSFFCVQDSLLSIHHGNCFYQRTRLVQCCTSG